MKRYTYDEILKTDAQPFRLSPDTKSEIPCTFTNLRVDRETIPEGKYLYEIMGTDSGSIGGGIIKTSVMVNFVGSLISDRPIKMTKHVETTNADGKPYRYDYRGVGSYSF